MRRPNDGEESTERKEMNKIVEAKVQHRFRIATAEEVFGAWLNEDDVRAWMESALKTHGLAGDIRRIEIDPRPDGSFFFIVNRSLIGQCQSPDS